MSITLDKKKMQKKLISFKEFHYFSFEWRVSNQNTPCLRQEVKEPR